MRRRCGLWCTSLVALASASFVRGCHCGGSPRGGEPGPPWTCATSGRPGPLDVPCASTQHFAWGACGPERCDAPGSPGCCPGTVCTGGGACVVPPSRVRTCLTDADCDPGKQCLARPRVKAEAKTCGYPAAGTTCGGWQELDHRCVGSVPCAGACAAGEVCNIDLDFCEDPGPAAGASCDVTCGPGELLMYADPDLMLFDQCCQVDCACLPVPGVPPGVWGRYDDLAVVDGAPLTSAYDSTYGDLVLARFDGAAGTVESLDFVDGVPTDGPVVANPLGARGGRDAPGPDVGLYTAMVVAGSEPRIVYYDAGARDLKLAVHDAVSGWSTSLVDDGRDADGTGDGDVGRYASLAVDDAGLLHATYYVHRATRAGTVVTGVMYARSRAPVPAGYDDWDRVAVELVPSCDERCEPGVESCVLRDGSPTCARPSTTCAASCDCDATCVEGATGAACAITLPPSLTAACGGACAAGSSCVWQPGGTTCVTPRTAGCDPACASGEICVDDGSADGVCRKLVATTAAQGLPAGVGLFTSLRLQGGAPVVAYYDRLRHQARAATAAAGGALAFDVAPLACAAGQDLGQHTSLAVDAAGLAVALQGDDGATLWVCAGATLTDCRAHLTLVDDGARGPGDHRRVGAYASLAAGGGELYVAYQDQSTNDLELAYTRQGEWRRLSLAAAGARGYFARLRLDGTAGWVSDFVIDREASGRDESHLEVQRIDLTELP